MPYGSYIFLKKQGADLHPYGILASYSAASMSSLLVILCVFFLVPIARSYSIIVNISELPKQCFPPFNCGNGLSIRYPFWHIDGEHDQQYDYHYCGYPSLGVSCDAESRKPTLRLPCSTETFYVEDIDYYARVVALVGGAVDGKSRRLGFSSVDKNIPVADLEHWLDKCEDSVAAPLSWINTEYVKSKTTFLRHNISELLNIGFKLKWSSDETCRTCEDSLGFCGFSTNATRKPICFCKNGNYSKSCNDVVIGVARRLTQGRRRKRRQKEPKRKEKKVKPKVDSTSSPRPQEKASKIFIEDFCRFPICAF